MGHVVGRRQEQSSIDMGQRLSCMPVNGALVQMDDRIQGTLNGAHVEPNRDLQTVIAQASEIADLIRRLCIPRLAVVALSC